MRAIQKWFLIIISGSLYKSFSINICVIDIYSYGYAGGEMFTFCCTKNLQLVEKCQFRNAKITLIEEKGIFKPSFVECLCDSAVFRVFIYFLFLWR